jgi:phosphotransferase system  glucose/maltose/N-acetylglucosamine-specific IIC component
MAIATLAGVLVCISHLYWIMQTDFMILKYSTHAVRHEPWVTRLQNLLSFYAQQLRNSLLPLILGVALYLADRKKSTHPESSAACDFVGGKHIRTWLFGLLYFPIIASVVLNQFFEVKLMNHWGVELMLFFPLWLAYKVSRNLRSLELNQATVVVAVLHIISMATFLYLYSIVPEKTGGDIAKKKDILYPAEKLTEDALKLWRSKTNCPLEFVGGAPYQAGLISIYSGEYPIVFDVKSISEIGLNPWVSASDINRDGALIVYPMNANESEVTIEVILPDHSCD